jgi:hypothetical protein
VIALVGVIAAATGVGGITRQLAMSDEQRPVVSDELVAPAASAPPHDRAVVATEPLVSSTPELTVRREPVGRPSDYPGSILAVPDAAIAAYQRAEVVIDTATDCGLDWTVLAAIARVESDHGRGDDPQHRHRVTAAGLVRPGYVGRPLDGTHGTGRMPDTDVGRLDGDQRWDAPVGPMGLLPSDWANVAVDADGDGKREVQDLDDAALGAAVVLCADAGRDTLRRTLRAYHPGPRFVTTVLALHARYERQSDALPPVKLPSGGVLVPDLPPICGCDLAPARAAHTPDGQSTFVRTSTRSPGGKASGPPATTPAHPVTPPTSGPPDPADPTDVPTTDPPTETPTETPSETPTSDAPSDTATDPAVTETVTP